VKHLALLLLCALLAACAARPRAVVVERSTEPNVSRSTRHVPAQRGREYLVVRGDTLYGIAFRHGVDFRDLARWNGIASPYTIYPGQRLTLSGDGHVVSVTPPAPRPLAPRETRPLPPASRPGIVDSTRAPPLVATTRPALASTTPPKPVAATTSPRAAQPAVSPPIDPPKPLAPSPVEAQPANAPLSGVRNAQGVTWRWPASGQIVSKYVTGDPTRQGVNIAGSAGQPVFAAAAGEVVYSGAGLIGYGELIIIKHSDTFLSAYGHNRKRLVSEGQKVASGQQIAEMGRSGAARDMLHFEIRKSGKPVDPLPLLPQR
jgi:lipoprotein NlpD